MIDIRLQLSVQDARRRFDLSIAFATDAPVVADSRQPALARDFVAFLGSAEAQAILAKYGFGKP